MQKKKSLKRINKTLNLSSKKQQKAVIPVKDIMRQIGQLKRQLVSIKSKKHLKIPINDDDYLRDITCNTKRRQHDDKILQKTQTKTNPKFFQTFNQSGKQNYQKNQCQGKQLSLQEVRQVKKSNQKQQKLRIELESIKVPKSRQVKLKVNIQVNKIKSILERILMQIKQRQQIQLLVAQFNTTIMYIDSCFNDYQHHLKSKKADFKQMRTELALLSENAIKLAQKHSNQKNLSVCQLEQIAELKRHLTYYIHLMNQNKEQVQKSSKEIKDLQLYNKQLQNSNYLLRNQVKLLEQKKQQIQKQFREAQSALKKRNKQLSLLSSDMHLAEVECQKNKDRRKQIEKLNDKLNEQLSQLQRKYNFKQYQLSKFQQENIQMTKSISDIKNEAKVNQITLANKCLQLQRMQRQIEVLSINLQKKQQIIRQQDQQLSNLKLKLQNQIKMNKKMGQNIQYLQMQIQNYSQQIDELKKSNQRYKNKHFRDKFIQNQNQNLEEVSFQKNDIFKTDKKKKDSSQSPKRNKNSHSKNKQKIIGQIQQIIQKHKRQSDSSDEDY